MATPFGDGERPHGEDGHVTDTSGARIQGAQSTSGGSLKAKKARRRPRIRPARRTSAMPRSWKAMARPPVSQGSLTVLRSPGEKGLSIAVGLG